MAVSARPDGTTQPTTLRSDVMCDAHDQRCPGCGHRLMGPTIVRQRVVLQTCRNTVHAKRPSASSDRRPCGQKVMLIPYPDDMVRVMALTDLEFEELKGAPHPLRTLFQVLGMFRGAA